MNEDLKDPNKAVDAQRLRELFDYQDGKLIRRHSTSSRAQAGQVAGTVNGIGYRSVKVDGVLYGAHRLVFLWHNGWIPSEIDHINRDRKDNRIENLRPVNRSQNNLNASIRKDNTSGVKGVYWSKTFGKWHARIWSGGKKIHIGYFKSFDEATKARNTASISLHGTFGALQ